MTTNGESKFSYLLIGLGPGAIGGLIAAVLARKETRELLRERARNSFDYLNEQVGKLRESADEIVKKGKEFIGLSWQFRPDRYGSRKASLPGRQTRAFGGIRSLCVPIRQ